MKQKQEKAVLRLPRKRPRTVQELYVWQKQLLEDSIYLEFRQRALRGAIGSLNGEVKKYVGWLKEGESPEPTKLALRILNTLLGEFKDQLADVKGEIRITHDTNEWIIERLLVLSTGEEAVERYVAALPKGKGANILHEPGWLFEMECADDLEKAGLASFLTFGTMFDAGQCDMVSFPAKAKITWPRGYPPPPIDQGGQAMK